MDHIFIKEEVEDTHDAVSLSSASESYSSRSSNTSISQSCSIPAFSSISFPPTQRVIPSTMSARQGEPAGVGGGFQHFSPNAIDIVTSRSKHHRSQSSLMSPPLLRTGPSFQLHSPNSNLAVVPGYPQKPQAGAGSPTSHEGGVNQEDEWKNIKVVRRKNIHNCQAQPKLQVQLEAELALFSLESDKQLLLLQISGCCSSR